MLSGFGFKGFIIIKIIVIRDKLPTNDIVAINFHLSSKSFEKRRQMIVHSFEKVFKYIYASEDNYKYQTRPGTVLLFGDFNARTGANFKEVPDGDFHKPTNELNIMFKYCLADIPYENYSTPTSTWQFKDEALPGMTIKKKDVCPKIFQILRKFDEYLINFNTKHDLLNLAAYCQILEKDKKPATNLHMLFSTMKEAQISFGPSFCFDKQKRLFGCHKEKELNSYTDRVFMAQKAVGHFGKGVGGIENYTVMNQQFDDYSFKDGNLISDHGMVYAGITIGNVETVAQKNIINYFQNPGKSIISMPNDFPSLDSKKWPEYCKSTRKFNIGLPDKQIMTNDMWKEALVSSLNNVKLDDFKKSFELIKNPSKKKMLRALFGII